MSRPAYIPKTCHTGLGSPWTPPSLDNLLILRSLSAFLMDSTTLSVQLQQAWLFTQINKLPPPAFSPLSDHLPASPSPWNARSSDISLDPSSPDFFWSDFSEVSDSWNPPVGPAVSSSSSDGAVLPRALFASAVHAACAPGVSESVSGLEGLDSSAGVAPVSSVLNFSSFEDDVFMDHTLDYISEMLMDDKLEDRKCMEQECSAYQAIVNGFYEILGGEDSSSHSSCTDRSSSPTVYEAKDEYSWIDDVLVADPTSAQQMEATVSWQLDSFSASSSSQDLKPLPSVSFASGSSCSQDLSVNTAGSLEGGRGYFEWQLDSFSASSSSQDLKPLPSVSFASGSSCSQDSSVNTAGSLEGGRGYFEGASVLTQSYLLNGSATVFPPNSGIQALPVVSLSRFDLGAGDSFRTETPSQVLPRNNTGEGKFRRVKSEDHSHPTTGYSPEMNGNVSDRGVFRRATSDKVHDKSKQKQTEFLKFVVDSNTSSDSSYGTVKGASVPRAHDSEKVDAKKGYGSDVDHRDVNSVNPDEKLSFVKNENLNAEMRSRMLSDWSVSDKSFLVETAAHSNGVQVKRSSKLESVDLRGLLVSCAQAVASNDLRKANELLQDIRQHSSPYGSAGQRLAHYFAEALFARISGTGARLYTAMSSNRPSAAKMLKAFHLFVGVCPYASISHYFANGSILKAAEGASRLHIVDYGILYGVQWPCLISALADREGGPPFLRITGIEFPQPGLNPAERLEETGRRLAEYANTYNVPFEFHAIAGKWEDVEPADLHMEKGEVLAVNCIHRLHHLLDESVVAASPRRKVLSRMHSLKPNILVVAALNAGYNAPFFVSRFREALYHYSSKFDILDTTVDSDNPLRLMMEKEVIGRDILNVVACEGPERVERPETYRQWQARFQRAGFEQLPLNQSLVLKARALVKGFYHKDFGVDEDSRWMLLGWKGRIVDALSSWRYRPAGTGK